MTTLPRRPGKPAHGPPPARQAAPRPPAGQASRPTAPRRPGKPLPRARIKAPRQAVLAAQASDQLDLNRDVERQLCHPDRAARVSTGVAEELNQQV
jgi:hypothetical protein